VIDPAASAPENRDLLNDRLGRLRTERKDVERRLHELELAPVRTTDPEAVVNAILAGLADARQLFEQARWKSASALSAPLSTASRSWVQSGPANSE
jgi:hypothetical protein